MEFLLLAGLLLLVFAVMMGIYSEKMAYSNKQKDILRGQDLVDKVQKEIAIASRVLDGYQRQFTLPSRLGNKEYTIRIIGKEVIASTDKQDFWRPIPSVVGNVTKGQNNIKRQNGTVYLN